MQMTDLIAKKRDGGKLTAEEIGMLNETAELYKRYHKDVVENGDLYHIADPSDGDGQGRKALPRRASGGL